MYTLNLVVDVYSLEYNNSVNDVYRNKTNVEKKEDLMSGTGLLSVDQVATQLGVPRSWVYNAAEAGRIPALKLGKYVKFDPEELRQWLVQRRHGRKTQG